MANMKYLEKKAKETLQLLSNHDQSFSWNNLQNEYQPKSVQFPSKKTYQQTRQRTRVGTAAFTGKNIKNLVVPRVVTFEECPHSTREPISRSVHRREPKKKHSMSSNRTLTGLESVGLEQQIEGIDFMKYWVRHRFQEKSIDSLVSMIENKRRQLRELRG